MSTNLLVITASTRPGRAGPVIADWVAKTARAHGSFDVSEVDLAAMNLPLLDEPNHPGMQDYQHDHTKAWSDTIAPADAFIFVTPEYDYFPPASIVNAIQCLVHEWRYKPAGVVSYGGVSGGMRGAEELRKLAVNLGMMPIPQSVPLPFYPEFVQDGVFTPNEKMSEGAQIMLTELAKLAPALKTVRS
ncbi:NADPH-dependent FMN reductase [Pseudooceanicola sp. C21-150M6]|uniref:NADPH-dependent FMN reductase n=1 Tax=Pseudooceanicola sp. C21-150M6 TaxID=3434355 RepID=UPI003D7FABB6